MSPAGGAGGPTLRPTGSGAAVLAGSGVLLLGGLLLGYPTLTGLGSAGVLAMAVALGFVLIGTRLRVTRSVAPDRITVGDSAHARLEVTNLGRLTTPRVDAVDHLDGVPLPVPVPAVHRKGRQVLDYPIDCRYRGLVRIGPVVLDRRDPLGLVRRSAELAGETTLWVHPRVHQLRPLPVGVVPDFEGRLTDAAPRGSMAFSSLREYAPGDDPRQIHWRTSARLGRLVVREHVDTNEPTLSIVLDTRRSVLTAAEFEAAVELAASVAVASGRVGHAVALSAVDEDRAAVAKVGGYSVADRLAALRQSALESESTLLRLVEQAPPGGCLVVLSGDEPGLVAKLAMQRRRFSRVVVLLFDAGPPDTTRPSTAPPDTAPPLSPASRLQPRSHDAPHARITRRPGLAVVYARTAADATQAWNQLVHRQAATGSRP